MTHGPITEASPRSWRDLVGHPDQHAGTRIVEVLDGSGYGSRILEVWNATGLECDILLDRGFDIYKARYRGMPLSWLAPTGLQLPEAYEPGGFGWLRSFHGGLLTTCGFEHAGNPVRQRVPEYLAPDDRLTDFGEHGRIGSQRAELEVRRISEEDEPSIELIATVRQAALHAENITLRRHITIPVAGSEIRIHDRVTNEASTGTPHAVLYHINLGYPLIDGEQTHIRAASQTYSTSPLTTDALERVWPLVGQPGAEGSETVEVTNSALPWKVQLEYDSSTLPRCVAWEIARTGVNVLGLAPTTGALILHGREHVDYRVTLRVIDQATT